MSGETPRPERRGMKKWARVSLWAIAAAGLDLGSKALALKYLQPLIPKEIISKILNFFLVDNSGAAFSLFSGDSEGQGRKMALLSLLALLPLTWFLVKAEEREKTFHVGLGLVYGGAIGNVYDRLTRGAVVDFIDFHWGDWHWPAFNIADIAICVGAGLLILGLLLDGRREKNAAEKNL